MTVGTAVEWRQGLDVGDLSSEALVRASFDSMRRQEPRLHAILATDVLHKWTGWVAYSAAVINLAAAPSVLGGTDITGFYTASGYAPFVGQAAMLIWFFVASVSMIVKR